MACSPGFKVTTRYYAVDWYKQLNATLTTAELQRKDAREARLEIENFSDKLQLKTRWGQHDTNIQLATRIDEVQKWKETMERKQNALDREIATLSMAKEQAERSIDDKTTHLDIIKWCLMTRDQRQRVEVVKDGVDDELTKESKVVEGAKEVLNKQCNDAIEQLCLLQEIRNVVSNDVADKRTTLAIDCDQLHLDNEAKNISFKLDVNRIPTTMITHENWIEKNKLNELNAEGEIRSSQRMRENIYNLILQTDNDVMSQKDATEFEFRKKIHVVKQAVDEHQWQKKNLEDEMASIEMAILEADNSFRAKTNSIKLLETRLENRQYRPNMELCLDNAQKRLMEEWKELRGTIDSMKDSSGKLKKRLMDLESTRQLIINSMMDKMHALQLDVRCMEERQKLPSNTIVLDDTDTLIHPMGINQNLPETNWIEAATDPSITSGRWNKMNANVNQMRTAWELGRTDPKLVSNQIGINPLFGSSGLYANAK